MPTKRTYGELGDACATAHAMEVLGDVWTYPILRELFLGPKRFGELESALLGITPAVLTTRLTRMADRGLVVRDAASAPVNAPMYRLTEWAATLEPIMHALAHWAHDEPGFRPQGGLTPDGVALAIRAMAPASVAGAGELRVLVSDRRQRRGAAYVYTLAWGVSGVRIERAGAADPDVRVDSSDLAGLLFGDLRTEADPRLSAFVEVYRGARERASDQVAV